MKVFIDTSLIVYLNIKLPDENAELVDDLWLNLLSNNELYTNLLVLDEVIYVSKKKYDINYKDTIELIDKAVIPYVDILPIGDDEYIKAKKELMSKYGLKPSDAIHVATVINNGLQAVASEDRDFDRVGIKRIWVK